MIGRTQIHTESSDCPRSLTTLTGVEFDLFNVLRTYAGQRAGAGRADDQGQCLVPCVVFEGGSVDGDAGRVEGCVAAAVREGGGGGTNNDRLEDLGGDDGQDRQLWVGEERRAC